MRKLIQQLIAAFLCRERSHWRLRWATGDAKLDHAADVVTFDRCMRAALRRLFPPSSPMPPMAGNAS